MKFSHYQFLKNLQKELRTQNNCGTRDPKYWAIRYKESYIRPLGYGEDAIVDREEGRIFKTPEEFIQYVSDNYSYAGEYNEDDDIKRISSLSSLYKALEETLKVYAIGDDMFELVGLQEEWVIADYSGAFLTKEAADKHLEKNRYHYGKDAHAYCYYAERNFQLEKLLEILKETDWDKEIANKED